MNFQTMFLEGQDKYLNPFLFSNYQRESESEVNCLIQPFPKSHHLDKQESCNIFSHTTQEKNDIDKNSRRLQNLLRDKEFEKWAKEYNEETRRDKLSRYLRKKQERVWYKKISYVCRQKVANKRKRINGRFIGKKQDQKLEEPNSINNYFQK